MPSASSTKGTTQHKEAPMAATTPAASEPLAPRAVIRCSSESLAPRAVIRCSRSVCIRYMIKAVPWYGVKGGDHERFHDDRAAGPGGRGERGNRPLLSAAR